MNFYLLECPRPPKKNKTEKPEVALNGTAPNGNRHSLSTIGSSKAGSPAYATPHFHTWRTTYKDLRSMEVDGDTLAGEGGSTWPASRKWV